MHAGAEDMQLKYWYTTSTSAVTRRVTQKYVEQTAQNRRERHSQWNDQAAFQLLHPETYH